MDLGLARFFFRSFQEPGYSVSLPRQLPKQRPLLLQRKRLHLRHSLQRQKALRKLFHRPCHEQG
jgi:hypothetical protein